MSIFSRLFRRGTSLAPAQAVTAIANRAMMMAPRSLAALLASAQSMPERTAYSDSDDWSPHGSKPEHLITIKDGVGVITVRGPLFQRWDIYTWWWGGTGYDMIVAAARALATDAGVRQIVLDLDSPGGQCSGCWDTVDALRAVAAVKPLIAVINDDGFSATYAIATSAPRIVVTRTGGAGSIGVRWTHLDVSKWNERVGIAFTDVVSGEKKAAMLPNAPLSPAALAEMQAEVDRLAGIFFEYVASARGMTVEQVQAMQAGIYFGAGAVSAGLCDDIGTIESVLEGLAQALSEEQQSDTAATPTPAPEATAVVEPAADVTVGVPVAFEQLAPESEAPPAPHPAAAAAPSFADSVLAANLPAPITVALQKRGPQEQSAEAAVAYAVSVRDLCAAAGIESVAADYVQRNVDIETVRKQLLDARADTGPEIITAIPVSAEAGKAPPKKRDSASDVYNRRRAAAAGSGHHQRQ